MTERPSEEELAKAAAAEEAAQKAAVSEARTSFSRRQRGEGGEIVRSEEEEALEAAESDLLGRVRELRASYPDLSETDILDALKEARAEVEAKRREAQIKRLMTEERARLRREEGLTVGSRVLDEIVEYEIDIQPWQNPIAINMEQFFHGQTYRMPRHRANQIAEMAQWGRRLQRELDGKDSLTEFYRKQKAPAINSVGRLIGGTAPAGHPAAA